MGYSYEAIRERDLHRFVVMHMYSTLAAVDPIPPGITAHGSTARAC